MPRSSRTDVCARHQGSLAVCGAIAIGLLGSVPAGAQAADCPAPQQSKQQVELMFGRNIGGRLGVTEAAWSRFLAREVTPRFPDGLTVLDAAGQWLDKERGLVVREPSKLVMIVTADDAPARDKIGAIVTAYKAQFQQQSVGVVSRSVCAIPGNRGRVRRCRTARRGARHVAGKQKHLLSFCGPPSVMPRHGKWGLPI